MIKWSQPAQHLKKRSLRLNVFAPESVLWLPWSLLTKTSFCDPMTMRFKYKVVNAPNNATHLRPVIPVQFIGSKDVWDTMALLDSGADVSVISKDQAEAIGVPMNGERTIANGVTGPGEFISSHVGIHIEKGHEDYRFNIPVSIILKPYELPPLLGRSEIFDRFEITFKQHEKRIEMTSVSPKVISDNLKRH
jgi:hypothetical protein